MDGKLPVRQAVERGFFLFLLLILPDFGFAQSAAAGSSPSASAAAQFQILDQRTVSFGQHSLTLNRVAPPVLPAATPTPSPSPAPEPPYSSYKSLTFSAIVYDHRFTVLQWINGDNRWIAVSNVDFNYFCYSDGFAKGDTFYELLSFLDNESATQADSTTAGWLAQAGQTLNPATAGYLIVSGTPTADEIQSVNNLHAYYAANSEALIQTYTVKQAQWAEQLLQLTLHPPVRPDTVINYWPIKSSVYLPKTAQ